MKINQKENKLANGMVSITLDVRHEGTRRQQRLQGIKFKKKPVTAAEREDTKRQLELVDKIIAKMKYDSLYTDYVLDQDFDTTRDFFQYAETLINAAPLSDKRSYRAVTNKLKKWSNRKTLPCSEISKDMLQKFKNYLDTEMNGITAHNYFKKLKKMIKQGQVDKCFRLNPAEEILNRKAKCGIKDTLTMAEIMSLANTPCSNDKVKRAFLFSCLTGLRFCDVSALTWRNIKDGCLDFIQSKTKERMQIELRDDTKTLIGSMKSIDGKIFDLPTHTGCLKQLKSWTSQAEITKHITWHCARHSYATNLIAEGVGLLFVADLMGHKQINQTLTYARVDKLKRNSAIHTLPQIF